MSLYRFYNRLLSFSLKCQLQLVGLAKGLCNNIYCTILPTTCTVLVALSFPAALSAVHVYWAMSFSSTSLISNEPLTCIVYLSPLRISWPSFVHVTVGFGTPVVGQWMVTLVLVRTVTLSPTVNEMGLRSCVSIVFGSPEALTRGLEGPL